MRKILFMLCILLLVPVLATASADMVSISELRQQVETMGRWMQTYEAYGRTIEVDIPIIVPKVESVPVLSVIPILPYHEWREISMLRKESQLDAFAVYLDERMMGTLKKENGEKQAEIIVTEDEKAGTRMWFTIGYDEPRLKLNSKLKYESISQYPWNMDIENLYAEENPYSIKDAEIYLEKVISYLFPDSENDFQLEYVEINSRARSVKGL